MLGANVREVELEQLSQRCFERPAVPAEGGRSFLSKLVLETGAGGGNRCSIGH
jgi:hypothetical protein